jgi:hypothetical protein
MLDATAEKGDGNMNKVALIAPIVFLIAAFYVLVLAIQPGETVQLIAGHEIPDRLAVLLGAIGLLGAVVVGAEALRGKKAANGGAAARDIRRAS